MRTIYYHKITQFDTANGVGIRVVLWVAGCEHHCKDCHNPQTWERTSGQLYDESAQNTLNDALNKPFIKGITFSGGDPLAHYNRQEITQIAKRIKEAYPEKSIWCYTGYSWGDVKDLEVLQYLDVLVDGEFILEQKDISLVYCGSTNQRVIDVQKSLQKNSIVLWKNTSSH